MSSYTNKAIVAAVVLNETAIDKDTISVSAIKIRKLKPVKGSSGKNVMVRQPDNHFDDVDSIFRPSVSSLSKLAGRGMGIGNVRPRQPQTQAVPICYELADVIEASRGDIAEAQKAGLLGKYNRTSGKTILDVIKSKEKVAKKFEEGFTSPKAIEILEGLMKANTATHYGGWAIGNPAVVAATGVAGPVMAVSLASARFATLMKYGEIIGGSLIVPKEFLENKDDEDNLKQLWPFGHKYISPFVIDDEGRYNHLKATFYDSFSEVQGDRRVVVEKYEIPISTIARLMPYEMIDIVEGVDVGTVCQKLDEFDVFMNKDEPHDNIIPDSKVLRGLVPGWEEDDAN